MTSAEDEARAIIEADERDAFERNAAEAAAQDLMISQRDGLIEVGRHFAARAASLPTTALVRPDVQIRVDTVRGRLSGAIKSETTTVVGIGWIEVGACWPIRQIGPASQLSFTKRDAGKPVQEVYGVSSVWMVVTTAGDLAFIDRIALGGEPPRYLVGGIKGEKVASFQFEPGLPAPYVKSILGNGHVLVEISDMAPSLLLTFLGRSAVTALDPESDDYEKLLAQAKIENASREPKIVAYVTADCIRALEQLGGDW